MSMELFRGEGIFNYASRQLCAMRDEVGHLSDNDVLTQGIGELADRINEKYLIRLIRIDEQNIKNVMEAAKIRRMNPFWNEPYEDRYHYLDGVRITYTIPFIGDPVLFELRPSEYYMRRFETSRFVAPQRDGYGSFDIVIELSLQELQEKDDAVSDYVDSKFSEVFESYKQMIRFANNDAAKYNDRLPDEVLNSLVARREKADLFGKIGKQLRIPLATKKDVSKSSNLKAISMKKRSKDSTKFNSMEKEAEWHLNEADYDDINNIIYSCGSTMEEAAKTFQGHGEEELRDHLLTVLKTHYESTTAEAFRRTGKTDIRIETDNKSAFIAECKIWSGPKSLANAVEQLLGYSTWRDAKISVIFFNKNNKSFNGVLDSISDWIDENAKLISRKPENVWKCKFKHHDRDMDVKLTVQVFDLAVNVNT